MQYHLTIGTTHAGESILVSQFIMIVNLSIANELTIEQMKWLIASRCQTIYGKTMKPEATMTTDNQPTVVRTTMRDFSKIGLQCLQHGRRDTFIRDN
jgi:hypothetical protein